MANDGHGQPGGRKIDVALRILQAFGLIGVAIAGGFLIGAGIAGMFDSPEEYRRPPSASLPTISSTL